MTKCIGNRDFKFYMYVAHIIQYKNTFLVALYSCFNDFAENTTTEKSGYRYLEKTNNMQRVEMSIK